MIEHQRVLYLINPLINSLTVTIRLGFPQPESTDYGVIITLYLPEMNPEMSPTVSWRSFRSVSRLLTRKGTNSNKKLKGLFRDRFGQDLNKRDQCSINQWRHFWLCQTKLCRRSPLIAVVMELYLRARCFIWKFVVFEPFKLSSKKRGQKEHRFIIKNQWKSWQ